MGEGPHGLQKVHGLEQIGAAVALEQDPVLDEQDMPSLFLYDRLHHLDQFDRVVLGALGDFQEPEREEGINAFSRAGAQNTHFQVTGKGFVRQFLERDVVALKKIFEDMSGAESTTLSHLVIKYREEVVPELKSKKHYTYKLNKLLKHKICYYNLLQLNSSNVFQYKKELQIYTVAILYLQFYTQVKETFLVFRVITEAPRGPL